MELAQIIVAAISGGAFLSAAMACAFKVRQVTRNSGWIDVFWTFGVGAAAVAMALVPLAGVGPRQIVVAALAGLWSLRLGLHIMARTRATDDDPRYRDLMAQWGARANVRLFWQLQIQAAVGLLLAVSTMLAAQNPAPGLRVLDIVAGVVLLVGIAGEAIADRQIRIFKSDAANRGAILTSGLWRFSRHPNYFFEWLCWLAYPIVAIDFGGHNPYGVLALAAPLCMYWILVHVSGIPPLEAHLARTRGDVFRNYQRRTSAFFPLPPRQPMNHIKPPAD
jgi:steroid 5-alpha reductase family enzyme